MVKHICKICDYHTTQPTHHKSHINSKTHKQKVKIKKLKYNNKDIKVIKKKCNKLGIKYSKDVSKKKLIQLLIDKKCNYKKEKLPYKFEPKKKTNKIIFELSDEDKYKLKEENIKKEKLNNFITELHNLLRGESVCGDVALDDILYGFFLSFIEDKISNEGIFDFQNPKYYPDKDEDELKELFPYLKITKLINSTAELRFEKNGSEELNAIEKCGELLILHPLTKDLFKNKDFMNCPNKIALSNLFKKIHEKNKKDNIFNDTTDIVGHVYEFFTNQHKGNQGKDMGQYFTERPLMRIAFEMIDKEDIEEMCINNDSTIGDEFCGTFGFPLYFRKFLKNRFNINIKEDNIYGMEFVERTFKFAKFNAMFSMNKFNNIKLGDSFIKNITPHIDFSVHNVPFGMSIEPLLKKKKYNKEKENNTNLPDYKNVVPCHGKKNDCVLSSQIALYKTKKMGLIILKDGEETSGNDHKKFREFFSKNSIIKKILKVPSGGFKHTGQKTVIIYFIKKENQKTNNIQFLEVDKDCNIINEICNISYKDLKFKEFSWNPKDYLSNDVLNELMSKTNCKWNKLSDIVDEIKTGKDIKKNELKKIKGNYPYLGSGNNIISYINKYNIDDEFIITGRVGTIGNVKYLKGKYWINGNAHIIKCSDKLKLKFIYHFLNNNKSQFICNKKGSDRERLNISNLKNILIPEPDNIEKIIDNVENIIKEQNILKNKIKEYDNLIKNNIIQSLC